MIRSTAHSLALNSSHYIHWLKLDVRSNLFESVLIMGYTINDRVSMGFWWTITQFDAIYSSDGILFEIYRELIKSIDVKNADLWFSFEDTPLYEPEIHEIFEQIEFILMNTPYCVRINWFSYTNCDICWIIEPSSRQCIWMTCKNSSNSTHYIIGNRYR